MDLSVSEGSESSRRMLGPCLSGPNAQIDLPAKTSQSYFVWKNSPLFLVGQSMLTCPDSISSAKPCKMQTLRKQHDNNSSAAKEASHPSNCVLKGSGGIKIGIQ